MKSWQFDAEKFYDSDPFVTESLVGYAIARVNLSKFIFYSRCEIGENILPNVSVGTKTKTKILSALISSFPFSAYR